MLFTELIVKLTYKMVYKKYIRRGGKVFGPYYYESYRENGKVKTRFLKGPSKKDIISNKIQNNNAIIIFFLGFIAVVAILLGFVYFSSEAGENLTGFAIQSKELILSNKNLSIAITISLLVVIIGFIIKKFQKE